jgi:hypothetical protein
VATVASDDGRCQIIMRDGVLLPGMTMPVLGPPPPDPSSDSARRGASRSSIGREPSALVARWAPVRRVLADHWGDPHAPRRVVLFDQSADAAEVDC